MGNRKTLLHNLLLALVGEWGRSEVEAALATLPEIGSARDLYALKLSPRDRKPARRPLASELVLRAKLAPAQEATIKELAVRFDRKEFLPTVSDVREFLIMMGQRPGAIKDRSDAFRWLLKSLEGLSSERLQRIAASTRHSGPSQLGPLSDAISNIAETLPRHRKPSGR